MFDKLGVILSIMLVLGITSGAFGYTVRHRYVGAEPRWAYASAPYAQDRPALPGSWPAGYYQQGTMRPELMSRRGHTQPGTKTATPR